MKRIKRPTWQYKWIFLQGFACIADGLVMVLSLGRYVSSYNLKVCGIRTKKHIDELIRAKNSLNKKI